MLFANAGVHLFATLEETSYEQLESIVGINVLGVFYLLKKTIPIMKQQQKEVLYSWALTSRLLVKPAVQYMV
jgi:NADP-dependent 3-hydroxy acid dehydrogenase YdfG